MKKLPIGISNLSEIIEGGYAYVDKTSHVDKLSQSGKYYFLSRPRRFGSSLFIDTLKEADPDALKQTFHGLFSAIPHDWYRKNNLAGYEGYYASVFYCSFVALGLDVTAEDATSHGRIDMTVKLDNRVFIFEFKVVDVDRMPGTAMEQVRRKGYANKYRAGTTDIYLIGVEFDRNKRNIVGLEWRREGVSAKENA